MVPASRAVVAPSPATTALPAGMTLGAAGSLVDDYLQQLHGLARVAEPDLTPGGLVPASPPDDGEDAATGRRRLDAPRGDLARPQHQGHVDQQLSRGDLRDHRREVAHPGAPETQKALARGVGTRGFLPTTCSRPG